MENKKIFYSIDETAALVGLGKTKIYSEIKTGALTVHKCGKRTLVSSECIEKWRNSLLKTSSLQNYPTKNGGK